MPRDLFDGESCEMQGSGVKPYVLKNVGGVYSCSCPAWRNQSLPINSRTCKHLRKLRGETAEIDRIALATSSPAALVAALSKPIPAASKSPPLLLANVWDGELDPTGWWMSEKLDGVRALWKDRRFITKLGNTYTAPEWFIRGLPEQTLDGELWMGRGKFQKTLSAVRQTNEKWGELRFVVFDAPTIGGAFEDRNKLLFSLCQGSPYIQAHPQTLVESKDHVKMELAMVEALGGEGLMLRRPGSFYEVGRSSTLLKVKSYTDDEAEVTGYKKGKNKNKDSVGSIEVRWKDKVFHLGIGLSDEDRETPPDVGTVIKFKYQSLTDDGIPRNAVYIGLRED